MTNFTNAPFILQKYPLSLPYRNMLSLDLLRRIFRKPIIQHILNEHILKLNNLLRLSAFLLILCMMSPTAIQAQDIHFSQYYNSPLTTNPALTGIFRGDIRIYGVLRSQWDEASTSYRTVHLAADGKLFNPANKEGFFSVGGQIFRDEAGTSDLSMTSLAVNGSYTRSLDRENFVSFGGHIAIAQRHFNTGNLSWNNQFNGESHNPNLDSQEDFDKSSKIFADFGAGINWHGKKLKRRSTMDVGAAFYHLSNPRQNFYDGDEAKLPMRISLYILPTVQVSDKIDLVFNANAQLQDKYTELLGGGALRYYLNTRKTKEVALQLGGAFRFNKIGDAAVIAAEVHHRFMRVGFSYDINVSKFKEATHRNGGPELTVRYTIHKVRPLKYRKLCPLL